MEKGKFLDKRVLVFGLGISGKAAAKTLLSLGARVAGIDDKLVKEAIPPDLEALRQLGLHFVFTREKLQMYKFDCVVVSPGISPTHPILCSLREKGVEIIGEIELALRLLKGQVCLGITGTNGKTTTALLVAHLLKKKGLQVAALGNVGVPLSQEVLNLPKDVIIVLELSSYQLEQISTPALTTGVLLNLTPDHLERHGTFENYAQAKLLMGDMIVDGDFFIPKSFEKLFPKLLKELKYQTFGECEGANVRLLPQGIQDEKVASIFPLGYRNKERFHRDTVLAAYVLTKRFDLTPEEFAQGVDSFSFPPHRLELAGEIDGISFYNDSKATNVASMEFALNALKSPLLLIAGGVDKGGGYDDVKALVKEKVKHLFLIGEATAKLKAAFEATVPVTICTTLDEAVEKAYSTGEKGDTVLLSPACASYDMFGNFEERGDAFVKKVKQLEKGKNNENEP